MARLGKRLFLLISILAFSTACVGVAWADEAGQPQADPDNGAVLEVGFAHAGVYVSPADEFGPVYAPMADDPQLEEQLAVIRDRATAAYGEIEVSIDISDLEIPLSDDNLAAIGGVLSEIVYANPSLFYVDPSFGYGYWQDEDGSYLGSLTLLYEEAYDLAGIPAMRAEYEAAMAGLLSWVPADATDVQKAKIAHDWLVRNCVYNTDAANTAGPESYGSPSPWNAYGALVDKNPVCQGYSLAFIDAMNRLGIESSFVANDEEQHAWNRVKLDGDWYNLDVTWDDPCWMTRGEGVTDGGFDATPETTFFLKSDAWFKADAQANPDNAAHASWSPEGVAGTNTQYDGFATDDWPTYSGPAATDPDLPSDLSEWGYRIEFGSTEGASFHEIDNGCFYVVDDGVTSVTPACTVYYEEPNGSVELPANAYDTTYRMMGDSSTSMSPTWSDVDAPLEVGHYYDVTAQAKPGSGYTNAVRSQGFWVTTKNNLWVYSASLGDGYAVPISGWPGVRYDIPKGADYDLTLSFDGTTLTEGTDYTVEWCNRDINPDMLDDEEAHQDAILGAKPTEPGRYYAHYKGKEPYFGDGVVMFDIVKGVRIDRTDAESYDPLFTDGTATYRVRVLGFDGEQGTDWNLELQLGEQGTYGEDTEEFANPLVSGTDYLFDAETGMLVLYGDKVFERCSGKPVEINAAVLDLSDSSLLYSIVPLETVSVVEPWVDYNFMQDRKMLAGDSDWIYSPQEVEFANAEYPDGQYGSYEILDVKIASSEPVEEDAEVVRVTPYDYDDSNHSWYLEAFNNGTATIEVTYEDIHGDEQSYTFTITVVSDLYRVNVSSQDGRMQALPGQSIDLVAEGVHDANYEVDMDESFTYSWSLGEGSEYATIVPDPNDSSRATVTFNALPEDVDFLDEDVQVLVTMQGEDDESQLVDLATNNLMLSVCSDYYELYPEEINPNMEVGESLTVTPEVRHYSSASQSASGYDPVDNATFYWDSSSNGFEFKNADGDTIGSSGSSEPITITRLDRLNSKIWLEAEWVDDLGELCDAEKQYEMDYRDYSISLNSNEYRLYGDGTLDVWVTYNQSLNTQYVWPVVTVGIYDWENKAWTQTFTEGQEYTVDLEDGIITLDGAKILAACDEGAEISVFARMMVGGTDPIPDNDATYDYYTLMACEPHVDYRPLQDVDVLPGQGGSVDQVYSAHVESAEYPNGADEPYEVTDVAIESQQPEVAGESVISLVKQYGDDDPTSVDYWWSYEALNYGTATIKVTYRTLEGQMQDYTFNVNVVRDLYRVDVSSVDGTYVALPGKSIELRAEGVHESVGGGGDIEGMWYEWSLGDDTPASTATITASEDGDTSHVTVTFAELDPEGGIPDEINVDIVATLMDQDSGGQPIERAEGHIGLTVMPFYNEVHPLAIDRNLAVGETQDVTAEVLKYDMFAEDPVPVEDVTFWWEYDEDCVEVTDAIGLVADEDGRYQGSQVQFTIKRLSNQATVIWLHAEWSEPWGDERSDVRGLQLDEIAEVGPADMECSWFQQTELTDGVAPIAAWENVEDASYYLVQASFANGTNTDQTAKIRVNKTSGLPASWYDFKSFFTSNGEGEYSFTVEAYDSADSLIAQGSTGPVQMYVVSMVLQPVDNNGQALSGSSSCGQIWIDMDSAGPSATESKTFYSRGGQGTLHAVADSTHGFTFDSLTVAKAGSDPVTYTSGTSVPIEIDASCTITAVFKQSPNRVTVHLDLGARGAKYADYQCGLINEDDPNANATASGSVITMQVAESNAVYSLASYLREFLHTGPLIGGRIDSEEGFADHLGTKPNMTDYASYEELEADESSPNPVTEGLTLYVMWETPVDLVEATIAAPVCGTQVGSDGTTGTPVGGPQVVLPADGHAITSTAYWEHEGSVFNDGTIEGGQTYDAVFLLDAEFGYCIADEVVVKVNGETASLTEIGAQYRVPVYGFALTAVHDWGEWTTVTPPTVGVEGLEKRVCSACDAEETQPIPALQREETPQATFTATGADTATLSGLEAGASYTVAGASPESFTATGTTQDLTGVAAGMVSVVKNGDGTTTGDSLPQEIAITKAETPALEAVQPQAAGEKGSIPTKAAHEYSTDGTTWTACTGALENLDAGTYYVRVAASGTTLASEPQAIEILKPTVVEHTVTFSPGTGAGSMDSASVLEGDSYELPACMFTKEGRAFYAWSVDGEIKQPGETITITDDTTVIAKWNNLRTQLIDESIDESTTTVVGSLRLRDRGMDQYYKEKGLERESWTNSDYSIVCDPVASEYDDAKSDGVMAEADEIRGQLLQAADILARGYTVTSNNGAFYEAEIIDKWGAKKWKVYSFGDSELAEYSDYYYDQEGDLFDSYVVVTGNYGRSWRITWALDAEYTSDSNINCRWGSSPDDYTMAYWDDVTDADYYEVQAVVLKNGKAYESAYWGVDDRPGSIECFISDLNNFFAEQGPGLYSFSVEARDENNYSLGWGVSSSLQFPAPEATPHATFTATGADTATLSGLEEGATYTVAGASPESFTATGTTQDLTGVAAGTVSVVKNGDGTTTGDSLPQEIAVTKAETPALEAVQPQAAGGKGSIPTTAAHEYGTDGATWTACTGTLENLDAGTYYVRVAASGTTLASEPQAIEILKPTVDMHVWTPGHGKVMVNGSDYGTEFEGTWYEGTEVQVEAVPDAGYKFGRWYISPASGTGRLVKTPAVTLTAGTDAEANATFGLETAYVTITPPAAGDTTDTPPQITLPSGAGYTINEGWFGGIWWAEDAEPAMLPPWREEPVTFEAGHTYYAHVSLRDGVDSFAARAGGAEFDTTLSVTGGSMEWQGNSARTAEDESTYCSIDAVIAVTIPEDVTVIHTVAFDANQGTGTMDSVQVEDGTSYTLPTACTFTPPEGYKFAGWTLDGKDVTQVIVNSNITVKAKWTQTTTRSVTWKRFAGATAPDTMKLIAGEFGKAKVAVVTTDANYKDALAASALAGKNGAIVLMTKKGSLTAQTKQTLKAAGVKTVYLVGSTKDVTAKVERALKSGTGVTKVVRVNGGSASAKAIAAAKVGGKRSDTVIIATQNGFQDALAIAPYSYVSKSPILYAEGNKKLSSATTKFIKSAKYRKAIIVGGPIALPASIEKQLKSAGVTSITRLAGTNAYRTSYIIADWTTGKLKNGSYEKYKGKNITVVRFQPAAGNRLQANKLAISTGQNWLDALAGAALCGKNKSVLLLADAKTTKSNYTLASAWCKTAFAKNTAFRQGYIFGGVKAVQPKVETALKTATKITTTNVYTIS